MPHVVIRSVESAEKCNETIEIVIRDKEILAALQVCEPEDDDDIFDITTKGWNSGRLFDVFQSVINGAMSHWFRCKQDEFLRRAEVLRGQEEAPPEH